MFGKPTAVVYLKRQGLELYSGKSQGYSEKLDFPAELVSSEEILDEAGFKRFLGDFFTKVTPPGQKVVLVLSDELAFSKIISTEKVSGNDLEEQKQKFFDDVPFDSHELSTLEFIYKNNLYLFASNKKLYEDVASSLSGIGRVVELVVPAFVFGISSNAPLAGGDIHKVLSGGEIAKMSNLLETGHISGGKNVDEDKEEPTPESQGDDGAFDTRYFFIPAIVIVVVLVLVGGYLLLGSGRAAFNFRLPFLSKSNSNEAANVSASPAASPAAGEQKVKDKSSIAVEVVNGTGIEGQAGRVKADLEGLGFSDVTTANGEVSGDVATNVEYAAEVDSSIRDEVESELKKTFEQVEVSSGVSDSNYQIIVTTGTEK